jgi:prepilin-type N-terminal cleavage/methylation domain-containing protein
MYGKWIALRRQNICVFTNEERDAEGFTLIELLVVIVVLGVLAAVVIFSLGGVTAQAASAACNANAKTVAIAVSAYEAENDAAPGGFSDLTQGSNPYLQAVPSSPYYSISLNDGSVMVAAPASATPVNYSSANACAGANTGGLSPSTTTTTTPTSTTTTLPTTTTTTSPSNGVQVATSSDNSSGYTGTDTLTFSNVSSVTSMTVTIRIMQTTGVTPGSLWNDFPGDMSESDATSGGVITYTYTLSGTALPANDNVYVTAQWAGNGPIHPTTGDSYSIVSTSSGVTSNLSGGF